MVQMIKVYLIGTMGTGKTSFMKYHTTGTFPKYYVSTMGIGVDTKIINIDDREYILKFFDLSPDAQMYGYFDGVMYSQEQINSSNYDHTCALAFYDSSEECQQCTDMIIRKFKRKCNNVPVISVMNKIDLLDENSLRQDDKSESMHRISLLQDINCSEPLFDVIRSFNQSHIETY